MIITATAARSASPTRSRRCRSARPISAPARNSASPSIRTSTAHSQEGVGYYQLTQKNARRSSASVAYLKPIRDRKNLTVRTGVMVTRVVVEKGRAIGVEIVAKPGGQPEILRADREVIVSSGAIGSPKLLMLSGIGPADHLKSVGIEPVHDLPGVGSNLQDHLDLFVIAECSGDFTYDNYAKLHRSAWAGLQYLLFRKGPVASSLFETGGFWYADPTRGSARHPVPSRPRLRHRGRRREAEESRRDAELRLPAARARAARSGFRVPIRPQLRSSTRTTGPIPTTAKSPSRACASRARSCARTR